MVCQVKDLSTVLKNSDISDGNYLLYLNNTIPPILYNPDIYKEKVIYNDAIFDPYKNQYVAIGQQSDFNVNYPENYLANSNIIDQIVEVSQDISFYLHPQNENIRTNIVYIDDIQYNRPLILTNNYNNLSYIIKDPYGNLVDNYISIDPDNVTTDSIFVKQLIFTSDVTISTNSSFISIDKTESYNINIINSASITQSENHMIIINTGTTDIIMWLYIGSFPLVNLLCNNNMIQEPLYVDIMLQQFLTLDNNNVYFDSVDTKYFNFNINEISTITNNIVPILEITSSQLYNINEIDPELPNDTISQLTSNIQSKLNTWVYIDNIKLDSQFIYNNLLTPYTFYIFINNNTLYYNEKKSELNGVIELLYPVKSNNYDVFIYSFDPIFIKCELACSFSDNKIIIYCEPNVLSRNEIIKIGDVMILIDKFSLYYNSYVGTILNNLTNIPNIINGYYSYGLWSNFYEKNNLLKQNSISNLLYTSKNSILNTGDYYIDTFKFNSYNGNVSDLIFKFNQGVSIMIYRINNTWYYDNLSIQLTPLMVLIYDDIQYVINTVVGSIITFKIDPPYYNLKCYLPNQPFETFTISVADSIIQNLNNFNGWFEIYTNELSIYHVIDSVIDEFIADGEYIVRLFNIDTMNIKCDFTNSFNLLNSMDNANNYSLPFNIICNINTDEEYIYFTQSYTQFDFTTLQYCYNQYILVDSNHYHVINITSDRVYINKIPDNDIIKLYTLTFSAGNVNSNNIVSNSNILNRSYQLNYPPIESTTKGSMVVLLSSENNNLSIIIDDVVIDSNIITSSKLTQLMNQSDYNNFTPYFFYENYIPITINNNIITQQLLDLNQLNNILLQEITSDGCYIHYIQLKNTLGMYQIVSSNNFHNISTSLFFINCLIPVTITANNYLILNQPEVNIYNCLNTLERNTLVSTVYIKTNIINKPIKIQSGWKYMINLNTIKYNLISQFNRSIYCNSLPCVITFESGSYYLYLSSLIDYITHVYFNETEYIKSCLIISEKLKPEYSFDSNIFKIISEDINCTQKIVNRVNISIQDQSINSYNIVINNSTLGPLSGINYIGDNNLIKMN